MNVFGYRFVKSNSYEEARENAAERLGLINKLSETTKEKDELKCEVESLKLNAITLPFEITIGDPIPTKAGERRTYVAEVAGFHKNYLHDKLMYMIHAIHILFEGEENTKDQNLMLRGAVYAFRELDRWGNLMTSEHVGDDVGTEDTE